MRWYCGWGQLPAGAELYTYALLDSVKGVYVAIVLDRSNAAAVSVARGNVKCER